MGAVFVSFQGVVRQKNANAAGVTRNCLALWRPPSKKAQTVLTLLLLENKALIERKVFLQMIYAALAKSLIFLIDQFTPAAETR